MKNKKYIGIYYPNCYIPNSISLTTFSLFFDELHLITLADLTKNPTKYLKNLPDSISINVLGEQSEEEINKVKSFYQFVLNNRILLDKCLYYHSHLISKSITDFSSKLLLGEVSQEELIEFVFGQTSEQNYYKKFIDKFPEIKDDFILRSAPTAMKLSEENDWILLSDDPNHPVPFLSDKMKTVRNLTSILAEECIRISLPQSISLSAEDILIAREKLKDELIPFRMTMQKMSSILKSAIKDSEDIEKIKAEAKFIAESQVEPTIYELKRKIEVEKSKLWVRIFGTVVKWIPLIAKGYLTPTPDNLFKVMDRVYGDVGNLGEGINNINIAREPGITFFLKLDEIIKK